MSLINFLVIFEDSRTEADENSGTRVRGGHLGRLNHRITRRTVCERDGTGARQNRPAIPGRRADMSGIKGG